MRLVLKTKKGNLYRLTDPEALVTPDEWTRVCHFLEWLIDLARAENINLVELYLCVNEQL